VNALTIVDTDILIDAARQVSKAVDCLDGIEQKSTLAISVITQMEQNSDVVIKLNCGTRIISCNDFK